MSSFCSPSLVYGSNNVWEAFVLHPSPHCPHWRNCFCFWKGSGFRPEFLDVFTFSPRDVSSSRRVQTVWIFSWILVNITGSEPSTWEISFVWINNDFNGPKNVFNCFGNTHKIRSCRAVLPPQQVDERQLDIKLRKKGHSCTKKISQPRWFDQQLILFKDLHPLCYHIYVQSTCSAAWCGGQTTRNLGG